MPLALLVSGLAPPESSECHDLPLLQLDVEELPEDEELTEEKLHEERVGEAHTGKLCSKSTVDDFLGCSSTGRRGFGMMRTGSDTRSFIE